MEKKIASTDNLIKMIGNISKIIEIIERNLSILDELVNINILENECVKTIKKTIEENSSFNTLDFKLFNEFDGSESKQYINYINKELLKFNPSNYLISEFYQNKLNKFFSESKNNIESIMDYQVQDRNQLIQMFLDFSNYINEYISEISNFKDSLQLINKFKGISDNIVIVGKNGSGKSSLARQFKSISSSFVTFLSAQRILYYEGTKSISATGEESKELFEFQNMDKLCTEFRYLHFLNTDMEKLMTALISEHAQAAFKKIEDSKYQNETVLSRVKEMWNQLITHRKLNIDEISPYITYQNNESSVEVQYTFNQLSDGEKAIFYFIGHVLIAPKKSYIIIDEPEIHLHPAICNELWSRLEEERNDCKFIYITHNLSFAINRNATILWNKEFNPPYSWEFSIFQQDSPIPNQLYLEILGSRKKVCFCEGDYTSLDYKLYTALFPDFNIIPVGGHRQVISYVDSLNKINSKNPFYDYLPRAVGIIDGDYYSFGQKEAWKEKEVFTIPVSEIENILVDKDLLEYAVKRFESENNALEKYYQKFWEKVSKEKETLAFNFVKESLQCKMKETYLKEKKDIKKLQNEYNELLINFKTIELHDNTLNDINTLINEEDYESVLKFVNLKNFLVYDCTKPIVDKYPERIIQIIRKQEDLILMLRKKYFDSKIFQME